MPDTLPPLIRALLDDPACYDHTVEKVQLVETHISWVLLTGSYAYKIKKPVDLGFLDFSTLAQREQDCLEELRLNRRLAAEAYLEVVAICGSPAHPRINGRGEILEYAVKMRQFPMDATLDKLAERGELGNEQIDELAARLAHFHLAECERASADSSWGEPDAIAMPVEENFRILYAWLDDPAERGRLGKLQDWCDAEHAHLAPLMAERKQAGWVRECHGDLHLGNLAWVDGGLVIFDCLEFNPELRWIDVISEVAFCYMDLLQKSNQFPSADALSLQRLWDDHLLPLRGRIEVGVGKFTALAARFINAWLEATGDYQGVALLRYYAVYRALVRAKVAALRAGQGDAASRAELAECLQLALNISHPPLHTHHSPLTTHHFTFSTSLSLTITHGLSGSGKTTLSQSLLEKHGLIRLRSDVERKRLAGFDALEKCGDEVGAGLYDPQSSRRTYQHLAHLAEGLLAAGWPVVVDAAFLERAQRDLFRDLARRMEAPFRILDIRVDPDILRERVRRRQAEGKDASDADLCVLQHQLDTALPLDEDELAVSLVMELM